MFKNRTDTRRLYNHQETAKKAGQVKKVITGRKNNPK